MEKASKRLRILAIFTFFLSPLFSWGSVIATDETAVFASLSRMIWYSGSARRIFIAMLVLFIPMLIAFFLAHSMSVVTHKDYLESYRKEMAEIKKRNPNIERDVLLHDQLQQLRPYKYQDKTEALINAQHFQIMMLFHKAGASSPSDVGVKLTGSKEAYASKDWSEAHAECVADVMHNGENASPISIAYVREMDKLLGIRN